MSVAAGNHYRARLDALFIRESLSWPEVGRWLDSIEGQRVAASFGPVAGSDGVLPATVSIGELGEATRITRSESTFWEQRGLALQVAVGDAHFWLFDGAFLRAERVYRKERARLLVWQRMYGTHWATSIELIEPAVQSSIEDEETR